MKRLRLPIRIALLMVSVTAIYPVFSIAGEWNGRYDRKSLTYVSAKSVSESGADSASLSALSYNGPIGPFGPLGTLGPLGPMGPAGDWFKATSIKNLWKMLPFEFYNTWTESIRENPEGPYAAQGPLGANGPVGEAYFKGALFEVNPNAIQLRAQGLFSVLGPIGPLGALGPLGPLGPLGIGSLFEADIDGNYVDQSGQIVRDLEVPYGKGKNRVYELVEVYREDYFKKMVNDTDLNRDTSGDASFMVEGSIRTNERSGDSYYFTSNDDQFVTVLLLPEKSLDDFDLQIRDGNERVIAASDLEGRNWVEWIQLKAPKGAFLQVSVTLRSSGHTTSKDYRLVVTPSTSYLNKSNISGKHVRPWYR